MLPIPAELEHYQKIDPELIAFFRNGAEKEQEFRHRMNEGGLTLNKREQILAYATRWMGSCFAVAIVAAGLWMTRFLILQGMNVEGTIFGGSSLALMAYIFIGRQIKGKAKD